MQDNFEWSDVALFLHFLDSGRVPETARSFRIDETTVVRRLKRLQSALGLSLIEMREHRLVATEAAEALRGKAELMREAASQFLRASARQLGGPAGVVRVTALRTIFRHVVLPGLPGFRQNFPEIELNFIADSRNLSLSRREADIAVRLALPTGGELVTRKLGDLGFCVYAQRGMTAEAMPWLGYTEDLGTLPEAQWLEKQRGTMPVALRFNGIELLAASASAGLGKAVLPCFVGDSETVLERVNPLPVLTREIWLAVHGDDRHTARVRACIDFLVQQFDSHRSLLTGSSTSVYRS